MKVLVTGSNGFVGGKVSADLLGEGHEVIGLGRSNEPAVPVSHYLRHDLSRPFDLPVGVDAVVHCAALAAPWAHPRAFQAANVDGTRHVVEACERSGSPRLIYISSSSVFYRQRDQLGLTEESPIPADREQINVYSRTKRQGERRVQGYQGPWLILRPRAVFGPGDTVLFPRILRAAAAGKLPILTRPDGKKAWGDLIYIDNLAHYILEALGKGLAGEINLTNDQPVELEDFLASLLQRLGLPCPSRRVPVAWAMALARLAEWSSAALMGYREPPLTRFGVSVFAYSKTFDVGKCRRELGAPPISLDEGVERFATWWRAENR